MTGSSGNGSLPGADVFVKMWADFASSMAKAGTVFSPVASPPEMARKIQAEVLSAWADTYDRLARSEEFQSAMRQSLSATVEARKQLNDFLGRTQHELQGASRQDIDQLMLSLRHIERRVVDVAERLSQQLESIDQRLSRLESRLRQKEATSKETRKNRKKQRDGE